MSKLDECTDEYVSVMNSLSKFFSKYPKLELSYRYKDKEGNEQKVPFRVNEDWKTQFKSLIDVDTLLNPDYVPGQAQRNFYTKYKDQQNQSQELK